MTTTVIVELVKGAAPAWPRLEHDDALMAVGSSRPMEDAWRIGNVEMIRWLQELYGLHQMDAYQLLSQTSKAPIANVVDANYSTAIKVHKDLLPAADAYSGIHQSLRALARSL